MLSQTDLYSIMQKLSREELETLFTEILSPKEIRDLELRWILMEDLVAGKTQRVIAQDRGISLCKITRGARILREKNSLCRKLLSPLKP